MADHQHHRDGPADCDGCRYKSLVIGKPSDFDSRTPGKGLSRKPDPAWERGIAYDRPGMPILKSDLSPMGVKEAAEKRHVIEENKRRFRQATEPLTPRT